MECRPCGSKDTVKNGSRTNAEQNYLCGSCGRQFVEAPSPHYRISEEKTALINRLPSEKIPPAGTARAAQVSERWLQYYVNDLYDNVSEKLTVFPKKKGVSPLNVTKCGHS